MLHPSSQAAAAALAAGHPANLAGLGLYVATPPQSHSHIAHPLNGVVHPHGHIYPHPANIHRTSFMIDDILGTSGAGAVSSKKDYSNSSGSPPPPSRRRSPSPSPHRQPPSSPPHPLTPNPSASSISTPARPTPLHPAALHGATTTITTPTLYKPAAVYDPSTTAVYSTPYMHGHMGIYPTHLTHSGLYPISYGRPELAYMDSRHCGYPKGGYS